MATVLGKFLNLAWGWHQLGPEGMGGDQPIPRGGLGPEQRPPVTQLGHQSYEDLMARP